MTDSELANAVRWGSFWSFIESSAFFVVVVALAIEFAAQHLEKKYESIVISAKDAELAQLSAKAMESEKQISIAKAEAAKAMLELEKFRAPRSIADDQASKLIEKIKPFSGQKFLIVTYWDSKEPLALSDRINSILQSANWTYVRPEGWTGLMGGLEGVQVWVNPHADDQVIKSANALVDCLNEIGILSTLKQQSPDVPKDNEITINVGIKP
jgi:hypothetical protein